MNGGVGHQWGKKIPPPSDGGKALRQQADEVGEAAASVGIRGECKRSFAEVLLGRC